jgi:hypothetical protein
MAVSGRQGRAWQAGHNQEGKAGPGKVSLGEEGRSMLEKLVMSRLDKHGSVVLFRQSRASWSRQGGAVMQGQVDIAESGKQARQ